MSEHRRAAAGRGRIAGKRAPAALQPHRLTTGSPTNSVAPVGTVNRRLLFVVNDLEFFVSHRLPIARAARASGYDVHVATPPGRSNVDIDTLGLVHHEIPMSRRGLNPLAEFRTLGALVGLLWRLKPDLVHLVTMKPVLYGGIAARLSAVPGVVMAIAGLGYLSDPIERKSRRLRLLVLPLLRFALGHRNIRAIFQNADDRRVLVAATGLDDERAVLISGSGVELDRYRALPEPPLPVTIVLASRLLKPKGVVEFIEAARLLDERGLNLRFRLAGDTDEGNPLTVTAAELDDWREEGRVEIMGRQNDIPGLFAASHIVVLPSYYGEGLPRVLLEAAACGRAVVTTDHPGCRDAVEPGVTGLLVPPRDVGALSDAIEALARDAARRQAMGVAARRRAEREFGVDRVVAEHLRIYERLSAAAVLP
jgi:glycosyltransferase involved in cell wall biosynthesis